MDTTKCQARSCDATNVTDQESQWNLQMFTQIIKQETVQHLDEEEIPKYTDDNEIPQCINEEETFCNDYMSPCKPLQTLDVCVDYRDSTFYVFDELKKEFPENECPQPVHNRSSRLVIKNEELSQVIERHEFKQENTEESLSLMKNGEINDEQDPIIVKIESLDEHRVLDDFRYAGVHYDVLVTPQQVQCELCDRTFSNRYTLLIHNNEHIKVVLYPTSVDNKMNELHKCKCCDEYFNNHDNMLAHVRNVHRDKKKKSESYNKSIKPYPNKKNGGKMEYKCDLCERIYKRKDALLLHTKKVHVDYERMFKCSCGKQFRTPYHLSVHKKRQHNPNATIIGHQQFQCDSCQKTYKSKYCLVRHIKMMHYDYGKIFECSCGQQFPSLIRLSRHKKRVHRLNVEITSDQQFQCDSCHKFFKNKYILIAHIKRGHHNYDKIFECSCGEQFSSPVYLYIHKKRQHGLDDEIMNDEQFPCDSCHKYFKTKERLANHIQRIHYDYGKTFECSCGKQFRTPYHLYQHNLQMRCADGENRNNEGFQCHICQKLVKTKRYLGTHMKSKHYDYGKTFDCWCGKQFRTPSRLRRHECKMHSTNSQKEFQCDSCGKIFKYEQYIKYAHYDNMFSCSCGKQFSKPLLSRRHENRHNNSTALKAQFQCDVCQKFFKANKYLKEHLKNMHIDYGKVFECVCGKRFRTPLRLKRHERYGHRNKSKDTAGVKTNIAI